MKRHWPSSDGGHFSIPVRQGCQFEILKNAKFEYNTPHSDLYRHYYHAQAMINRGGDDWAFYNELFRDELLNNQNDDGSWKNVGKAAIDQSDTDQCSVKLRFLGLGLDYSGQISLPRRTTLSSCVSCMEPTPILQP